MLSHINRRVAGIKLCRPSLPASKPMTEILQHGRPVGSVMGPWPFFKWPPQQGVDSVSSWAEDKGGQEAGGNTGSSVEALIRNRGFPPLLFQTLLAKREMPQGQI